MILSPYDATVAKYYQLDKIIKALRLADTEERLIPLEEDYSKTIKQVVANAPDVGPIPFFVHPVNYLDVYDRPRIGLDVRGVAKITKPGSTDIITSDAREYRLMVTRAILQRAWNAGQYKELRAVSDLPMIVFTKWVSEAIARRIGLEIEAQANLTALTGWWFLCQFEPSGNFSDSDRNRMVQAIVRATNVPADMVYAATDGIDYVATIDDYVNAAKASGWSTRLQALTTPLMLALLSSSWFGSGAKEVVGVALEHPPTFYTLVQFAIEDRSYRNTVLGLLLKRLDKGATWKQYSLNFLRYIKYWSSSDVN